VKINGAAHSLWPAVDHEGEVLESFVTKARDRKAAWKLLKKAMRRHGRPDAIVTDRLGSSEAAPKDMGRGDDREMGRWLNNRAENSHLPFRRQAGDVAVPTHANVAEVRLSSCLGPLPLSNGAPSPKPQQLQADPRRRSRRVARPLRRLTPGLGGAIRDWFTSV